MNAYDTYMSTNRKWLLRPVFLTDVKVRNDALDESESVTVNIYFWFASLADQENEWFAVGITQANTLQVAHEVFASFENLEAENRLYALTFYAGVAWDTASDADLTEAVAGTQRRLWNALDPQMLETLLQLEPKLIRLLRSRLDLDNLQK